MDLMMGDHYKLTSVLCPAYFLNMRIRKKPEHGLEEFKNIRYYHKEGEDGLELRGYRRCLVYIYSCIIHDMIMMNIMMCNEDFLFGSCATTSPTRSSTPTTACRLRARDCDGSGIGYGTQPASRARWGGAAEHSPLRTLCSLIALSAAGFSTQA